MLQLAIPVFVLMSGAASLGFVVAWTWRKLAIESLQSELMQIKNVNYQIESERQNLVQHANLLQSEKESLLRHQSELQEEKEQLVENLDLLNTKKAQLEKLTALEKKLAIQRTDIQRKEEEIKAYQQETTDQLPPTEVEEIKKRFRNKYSDKKKKWEEKYRNLQFKLLSVARERDELKRGIIPVDVPLDFSEYEDTSENPLNKIKHKLSSRQDRSETMMETVPSGFISSDYGETAIKPNSDIEEKIDDLKVINGIDITIEEKLNALGVYRYEQISRLEEKDILLINKILDLKSDYILKNKWVSEARKFK